MWRKAYFIPPFALSKTFRDITQGSATSACLRSDIKQSLTCQWVLIWPDILHAPTLNQSKLSVSRNESTENLLLSSTRESGQLWTVPGPDCLDTMCENDSTLLLPSPHTWRSDTRREEMWTVCEGLDEVCFCPWEWGGKGKRDTWCGSMGQSYF